MNQFPKLRYFGKNEGWQLYPLSYFFEKQINTIQVEDNKLYQQLTISNSGHVTSRKFSLGNKIGRKRQFRVNLIEYPNTLTFIRQGIYNGGIGFINDTELDRAIVTENMPLLALNSNMEKNFFNVLLSSEYYKRNVLFNLKPTGSAQSAIHEKDWLKQKILVPSKDEQQKIGILINKLNILINEKEKEIKLLRKQNIAIFDYIYHKIDIDFTEVILSEIASGFDYGMNSAAIPYDGLNKYIRITDINESDRSYTSENFVSPLERVDEKYIVKENDILVTRTGGSVGKNYLYSSEDGTIYFAGFLIRINVRKEYTKYLFQFMNTHSYWKYITINSARSGQPGINAQELMNLKLKVPTDLVMSDNLGNVFENINMLIKSNENELESYKMLRGNLLKEMLV